MGVTKSCREYTHPRDEFQSYPKGVNGVTSRIGLFFSLSGGLLVLDVRVTTQFGRYGIEIGIDSLAKDRSVSCVVTSRCVERYAEELSTECPEPMYVDFYVGRQNPAPHPAAKRKMNTFPLLKGIGNIFLVWTECCVPVSQSRQEWPYFYVTFQRFEIEMEQLLEKH